MSELIGKKSRKEPFGRPTGYREEYCALLIEHMTSGLSFESFGAITETCKQTLYTWADEHPNFMDAKRRGTEKSRLFWEKMGIHGTTGNLKTLASETTKANGSVTKVYKTANFNAQSWNMNMKNRFGWKDRQEIDHKSVDGTMKPQVILTIPADVNDNDQ